MIDRNSNFLFLKSWFLIIFESWYYSHLVFFIGKVDIGLYEYDHHNISSIFSPFWSLCSALLQRFFISFSVVKIVFVILCLCSSFPSVIIVEVLSVVVFRKPLKIWATLKLPFNWTCYYYYRLDVQEKFSWLKFIMQLIILIFLQL